MLSSQTTQVTPGGDYGDREVTLGEDYGFRIGGCEGNLEEEKETDRRRGKRKKKNQFTLTELAYRLDSDPRAVLNARKTNLRSFTLIHYHL